MTVINLNFEKKNYELIKLQNRQGRSFGQIRYLIEKIFKNLLFRNTVKKNILGDELLQNMHTFRDIFK